MFFEKICAVLISTVAWVCPAWGNSFQELNGVAWVYSTQHNRKFSDLTNELDHRRGMKVVAYSSHTLVDENSEFFKKAQEQYRESTGPGQKSGI